MGVTEKRKNTNESVEFVKDYEDLRVFQGAMDAAMEIFKVTKLFPSEERYSTVFTGRSDQTFFPFGVC